MPKKRSFQKIRYNIGTGKKILWFCPKKQYGVKQIKESPNIHSNCFSLKQEMMDMYEQLPFEGEHFSMKTVDFFDFFDTEISKKKC